MINEMMRVVNYATDTTWNNAASDRTNVRPLHLYMSP